MKKFLLFITAIFICGAAIAQTIRWHIGDTVYQTTTCNAGESITPPTAPDRFGYSFSEWAPYKARIEYLESTGTQYIDTGYKIITEYLKLEVKFRPTTENGFQGLLGAQTANFNKWVVLNYKNKYVYIGSTAQIFTSNSTLDKANILEITVNNGLATLIHNDQIKAATYSGSIQSGSNLYIFDYSAGNKPSVDDFFIGEVYYVKIYTSGGVLVRDFIPVLDKNGTPCMYDKVEGKFYYNAGTGQFIAGPVIGE